jgi:plasmid maintenance system antidote protein VapI
MEKDELREIAEVWPPATFIVEEMKARKWNNSTLSKKSGRTTQRIKELLAGAEIGLNDADGLGRAFGTSKVYWLNLQDIFTKSLKKELHKEQAKMKELSLTIVEGHGKYKSVYLNGYRIAGIKPWGGGKTILDFDVKEEDIMKALGRGTIKLLYMDEDEVLHLCKMHEIHRGLFLVTTICGIDVPANKSFKSLETLTCKSCIKIISEEDFRETNLLDNWKEMEEVYDCPVHGTAHGGRGECPLC